MVELPLHRPCGFCMLVNRLHPDRLLASCRQVVGALRKALEDFFGSKKSRLPRKLLEVRAQNGISCMSSSTLRTLGGITLCCCWLNCGDGKMLAGHS